MTSGSRRLRVTIRPDDLRLLEECAARAQNDVVREASLLLAFGIRSSWQRWRQLDGDPALGITQLPLITSPDALREAAADAEAAAREVWQAATDAEDVPPKAKRRHPPISRPRNYPGAPPP